MVGGVSGVEVGVMGQQWRGGWLGDCLALEVFVQLRRARCQHCTFRPFFEWQRMTDSLLAFCVSALSPLARVAPTLTSSPTFVT